MRLLGWVVALASFLAWADDLPLRPDSEPRYAPRLGLTGGAHLGMIHWGTEGPLVGLRVGARLRLFEHLGLTAEFGWEHSAYLDQFPSTTGGPQRLDVDEVTGLLGVEVFSTGAFKPLFIPELSIIALGGVAQFVMPSFEPLEPWLPRAIFGVRLQMLRLWPSRWWFPVYVQLMIGASEFGLGARSLVAGIGI